MDGRQALLRALGRSGSAALLRAMRGGAGPWTLRGLARKADVTPTAASRCLRDLEALGAIEVLRPGRDAHIQWRPGPLASFLQALDIPDVRRATLECFQAGYRGPGTPILWQPPGSRSDDPREPTHIVILAGDEAWDALDEALDAVRAAGWPQPDVTVMEPASLHPDDPVAAAVLQASGTD